MAKILFYFLTLLIVVLTLIPFSKSDVWWVRGLDFPRLQLSFLALAVLIGALVFLELNQIQTKIILVLLGLSMVYQSWWIIPFTPIFKNEVASVEQPDEANTIRIMVANVLTPNDKYQILLDLVGENEPDILVTLESNHKWEEHLDRLESDYPHTVKCPLDNLYGMHVYSRYPLENAKIHFRVENDVPSVTADVVLPSGQIIHTYFLHPAPPSPTENEESTERDVELLLVAKETAEIDGPIFVTGDLNDVAWSRTTRLFRKMSGLLDPRVGRGMYNSFHADYFFIRWPLDHLFHSKHFSLSQINRLPAFGSDHFPIMVELVYQPQAKNDEGLKADTEDKEEAESKIEKKEKDEPEEAPNHR